MSRENHLRVLFATSEVFPLIKTGGLADVSGSLPAALQHLGVDVRILVPGYSSVLSQLEHLKVVAQIDHLPVVGHAQLLLGTIKETSVKVMIVKSPSLYERTGGPYADANGMEWADNPTRFGVLSRIAALLSGTNSPIQDWIPDIVHCNDWQTGLTPAYMRLLETTQAKSMISLHNMAFQGCYPASWLPALTLPNSHFTLEGFEYHGQLSFLKAGIYYADSITTVSPSYAKEIQTPAFGFGLEGLLSKRGNEIKGILNGIDAKEWNPQTDVHLVKPYSASQLSGKALVKRALQEKLGLTIDANAPVLGIVSRLTHQKGLDMLVPIVPQLLALGCQIVLLGGGESELEHAFRHLSNEHPSSMSATIGYNEPLSHQIMAGSDMFIMPSRFEPCGLNQLYGLAYGTPPIVNATGGLADSIINTNIINFKNKTANGFVLSEASPTSLLSCIKEALLIYKNDPAAWKQIQKNGMSQNLSWDKSALEYLAEYERMLH
jgi:starch synthase